MTAAELAALMPKPYKAKSKTTGSLTDDEQACLTHNCRWGSDGYQIFKRGGKWFVDGFRGLGACPAAFKTRKEAWAQWESYIDTLLARKAGRE